MKETFVTIQNSDFAQSRWSQSVIKETYKQVRYSKYLYVFICLFAIIGIMGIV